MDKKPVDFENLPDSGDSTPPASDNALLNRLLAEDGAEPAPEETQKTPAAEPPAPAEPAPEDEMPDDRSEEKRRAGIGCLCTFAYCALVLGL